MKLHIIALFACTLLVGCQSAEQAPEPEAQPAAEAVAAAPALTIEEFVRAVHIHGVPYDKASAYGAEAVPQLLEMLNDPKYEAASANIVVTLCIIADERAVDPVLAFIESGGDAGLSRAQYTARSSALISLGYIVNKTGNEKCLNYLRASVQQGAWAERDLSWDSPFAASRGGRDTDLSTKAILGLALSGTPAAADALRELQKPSADPAQMSLNRAVSPAVKTALAEHERIQRLGLSAYYKEMQAHNR